MWPIIKTRAANGKLSWNNPNVKTRTKQGILKSHYEYIKELKGKTAYNKKIFTIFQ